MSPAAATLLRERMRADARVLVLGAGGWFGSTFLNLIEESGSGARVLGLTGTPRRVAVGRHEWAVAGWDWDAVTRFAPTVVMNCAFLTRERVDQLGHQDYVAENVGLTSRFLMTLELPSVTAAVTVSSGAAVTSAAGDRHLEHNPYGHLKWAEEVLSREIAENHGVALVVCRAWSVSGPFVTRPLDYAFSELISQAVAGRVRIRAPHEVWRRYVGVDDLLAVCMSLAAEGWSGGIDSGGPLVEIAELAQRVVAEVRPGIEIERPAPDGSPPDQYHSDDVSWAGACKRVDLTPASLGEQIRRAATGLIPGHP